MKSIFRNEFRNYFKSINWVAIVLLHTIYGIIAINKWVTNMLDFEHTITEYLDYSNGGEFANIYTVITGFYRESDVFIVLLVTIIFLTASSLSYYMYELKGFINFELLRVSKNKHIFTKFFANSLFTGLVFVIPHILLIIYYSFIYTYKMPIVLDGCSSHGNCILFITNSIYSLKYPYTTLLINHLIKPFFIGFVIGLTVMTFT